MLDGLADALGDFFGLSEESSHGEQDVAVHMIAYGAVPLLFMGAGKLYTMIRGWLSDAYADETKREEALTNVNRTLSMFDDASIAKLKKNFPKSAAAATKVVAQLKTAKADLEKAAKRKN